MKVEFERQDMYHFHCKEWEQDFFIYLTDCDGSLTKKWGVFQLGCDGYEQMNDRDGFDTDSKAIDWITELIKKWDEADKESGVS